MIETRRIRSDILDNQRDLHILLPPDFKKEETNTYPVFYMHDGQNLFNQVGDWFKKWGIDDILPRLAAEGTVEPFIVVGITHLCTREFEFTPSYDPLVDDGGGADKYLDFIVNEVKPLIEKEFRGAGDREKIAIGGSSLGGIITLYAAMTKAQHFSKFAVMSPSLWWEYGLFLEKARAWTLDDTLPVKLWMDMGTREGPGSLYLEEVLKLIYDPVNFCRVLCNILISRGLQINKSLKYVEDDNAEHDEHAWGRRFWDVAKFFFAKDPPAPSI